MRIRNKS